MKEHRAFHCHALQRFFSGFIKATLTFAVKILKHLRSSAKHFGVRTPSKPYWSSRLLVLPYAADRPPTADFVLVCKSVLPA